MMDFKQQAQAAGTSLSGFPICAIVSELENFGFSLLRHNTEDTFYSGGSVSRLVTCLENLQQQHSVNGFVFNLTNGDFFDLKKLKNARCSSNKLETAIRACRFSHVEFTNQMRTRIADAFGTEKSRVVIFQNSAYLRFKCNSASTLPHSDFSFLNETKSMLEQINKMAWKTNLSCQCASFAGEKVSSICKSCVNGSLPFYTAWISFGNYQNNNHTLLEFVAYSHQYTLDAKQMAQKFPQCGQKYTWQFPSPHGVQLGDMLIFNCKTLHRAEPSTLNSGGRVSMDLRFAIVPEALHARQHTHTNTHSQKCTIMSSLRFTPTSALQIETEVLHAHNNTHITGGEDHRHQEETSCGAPTTHYTNSSTQ